MIEEINRNQIDVEGSPQFEYSIPQTNDGVSLPINCEDTSATGTTASVARKYLPFDSYKITNNSGQTIAFYRNMGASPDYIYSGQAVTVSGKSIFAFTIVPTGGAIAVDTVKVVCWKSEMTSDRFFRKASENVIFRALGFG